MEESLCASCRSIEEKGVTPIPEPIINATSARFQSCSATEKLKNTIPGADRTAEEIAREEQRVSFQQPPASAVHKTYITLAKRTLHDNLRPKPKRARHFRMLHHGFLELHRCTSLSTGRRTREVHMHMDTNIAIDVHNALTRVRRELTLAIRRRVHGPSAWMWNVMRSSSGDEV